MQEAINTYLSLRAEASSLFMSAFYVLFLGGLITAAAFMWATQLSFKRAKYISRIVGAVALAGVLISGSVVFAQAVETRSQSDVQRAAVQEELEDSYALELTDEAAAALLSRSLSSNTVSLEVAGQEVRVELARDSAGDWRLYRNGVALPEASAE